MSTFANLLELIFYFFEQFFFFLPSVFEMKETLRPTIIYELLHNYNVKSSHV